VLYKRSQGPNFLVSDWKQPVYVCMDKDGADSASVGHLPGNNGQYATPATGLDPTHWFRHDVTVNLTEGTYGFTVYDLGTAHPTLASSGNPVATVADQTMRDILPGEPITCFMIYGGNILEATAASPENAACFDNIVMRWKKPGTEQEVTFFENDFSVRRWRAVEPGPMSFEAAVAPTGDSTFTGYAANDPTSPASTPLLNGGNPGTDGWKRWNPAGINDAAISVVDAGGAGANALCFSYGADGQHFAGAMMPLGKSYTTGKVRLSADVRMPAAFASDWLAQGGIALGDARTYAASQREQTDYLAAQAGVNNGTVGTSPFAAEPTGGTSGGTIVASNWYRVVLTYDLDARQHTVQIYELGADSGTVDREVGDLVYEVTKTGGFIKKNCANIGTIVLQHYGPGGAGFDYAMLFDNIVFTEGVGTDEERVVYSNDFSTRTWYAVAQTSSIVGAIDYEGTDGWIRRSNGAAAVGLRGANPAVSFDSSGTERKGCADHTWIVQDLGGNVLKDSAKTVFSVDIRPPSVWAGASGWWANPKISQRGEVAFGGDGLAQGAHTDYFVDHAALRFGCVGPCQQARTQSSQLDSLGNSYTTWLYVRDGADQKTTAKNVDPTHWYRFVAAVRPGKTTYDVAIYDMGRAHPTVDTPTPATAAYTFENLGFSVDVADGITAVAIGAADVEPRLPQMADDLTALLFDNVVIRKSDGFSIIIR